MPDTDYSIAILSLISADDSRRDQLESKLGSMNLESLFPDGVDNANAARCCLSALWLKHGFLDQSHSISQLISTAEGSFWHAIMHRMEGDYWNSKYWFNRVGHHPIYADLAQQAAAIGADKTGILDAAGEWSPESFVDFCEEADQSGGSTAELRDAIAELEWRLLFDFCWNAAHE